MPCLILLRGWCEPVGSVISPTRRSPRLASSLIECLTDLSSDVRVKRKRRTEMNSSSSFMALSLDLTGAQCGSSAHDTDTADRLIFLGISARTTHPFVPCREPNARLQVRSRSPAPTACDLKFLFLSTRRAGHQQ